MNVPAFIGFVLVADKMEKLSLDFIFLVLVNNSARWGVKQKL